MKNEHEETVISLNVADDNASTDLTGMSGGGRT
jgi:hypothetical protein